MSRSIVKDAVVTFTAGNPIAQPTVVRCGTVVHDCVAHPVSGNVTVVPDIPKTG